MGKAIHVVPNSDGGWSATQEHAQRSSGNFDTQKEAIERAREIAKNNNEELVIHRKDGEIRQKDSHGNDPYPPKG